VKRLTRQERQAQTRAALLDAAARVFVRRGLQGSSVEEIAAEAGFTRGAFYSNFESKEQLFVELLHERVYSRYREMAQRSLADLARAPTPRQTGERLAEIQEHPDNRWLLGLWLECVAGATRDDELRELAATFWRGNRSLIAELVRNGWPEHADRAKSIATALIALDIGLSLQRLVDPDDVPSSEYPDLYELLFEPLRSSKPARASESPL
jgi:AcrR family transcriptional regulator